MICPVCGRELADDARFCAGCGAPRPTRLPAFARAEEQFERLRTQFAAGTITPDQFRTAVEAQLVDHEGVYWMLGVKSGKWYRHDGAAWHEAVPPSTVAAPTPQRLEVRASAIAPPTRAGLSGRLLVPLLGCGISSAGLLVLLLAYHFFGLPVTAVGLLGCSIVGAGLLVALIVFAFGRSSSPGGGSRLGAALRRARALLQRSDPAADQRRRRL